MEETNNHLYQDLLDGVLKMKDSNGRMICELFLKLPPRQVSMLCKLNMSFKVVVTTYQVKSPSNVCVLFWQQYPEYYRVIKEPIDLKIIYSQVKVGHSGIFIILEANNNP